LQVKPQTPLTQLAVPLVGAEQPPQVAPPVPHEELDSPEYASQLPALQQPIVQAPPPQEHDPFAQESPVAHMPQALPPLPQALLDCADCAMHWPVELQQPLGHDVALQTHCPMEPQAWPVPHAAQAAPPVPQLVADCWLYISQ
jgi:hypothetical protein